jgi:hypothetical protein
MEIKKQRKKNLMLQGAGFIDFILLWIYESEDKPTYFNYS